jgi:disulfide bond formation protein DsbB
LGAVFLTAGLIFALIILAPLATGSHYAPHSTWSDFGEDMGDLGAELGEFFDDFGDEMGELGNDLGDSFDHTGSDFRTFPFRFVAFCLIAFFFLFGIVLVVFAARSSRRPA